jgi:hypothetical protein
MTNQIGLPGALRRLLCRAVACWGDMHRNNVNLFARDTSQATVAGRRAGV